MCHEDPSNASQTFKEHYAHTQHTQSEQNQWKSNQSLSHVPERCTNIQGQNGVRFRHLPPENSCPKSRSKTRQRFPSEVHTEIRRQHCQISVNTHSQFTLTTHASLSSAKPFNACNYARNVPKMDASKS